MFARLLTVTSALALTACATGSDYVPQPVAASAAGPFIGSAPSALVSDARPDDHWWRLYDDPVLDGLVRDALAANTDVRVAMAHLAKARALLREERGAREPQICLDGSAQYGRHGTSSAAGGNPAAIQRAGQASVAYEVDLFGRIGRRIEAARGDSEAAQADADAVRVAVVADTVGAYVDAASLAERIGVGEKIVALLNRSLSLTERRLQVGLVTRLDTSRFAALRDQRRAEIPSLQAQRQSALFRLATLTGRAPRDLPDSAASRTSTLRLERPIPVGDGVGLLARRPDVRAAERRLAAVTARIGVATADLYPHITLGASVGSSASGLGSAFANPVAWLIGPLINWTVNRTAARARVESSKADAQAALATFDGTVLQSLGEVETALSNYRQAILRRDALRDVRGQADVAVQITRARQQEGDINSLELLDAERTAADAHAALAEADANIVLAQVDLFRALGGGWQR
jgi:NodT family efflux transporter outer membrane factor (OMF) lipoprotein